MLSFKKEHKRKSLLKNRGTACLRLILARACSPRIKTRYCLTLWWEAGLPMPNKSLNSPPRPDSTKSERSFPIRFVTVPATRVDGHEQTSAFSAPNKEQVGPWTLVFPFLSFHTKKRVTSQGEADNNVLGHGKEERKLSSSFRSLDFCIWHGLWSLTACKVSKRWSKEGRSRDTRWGLSAGANDLRLYPQAWQKRNLVSLGYEQSGHCTAGFHTRGTSGSGWNPENKKNQVNIVHEPKIPLERAWHPRWRTWFCWE